jgi:hypothetical protein
VADEPKTDATPWDDPDWVGVPGRSGEPRPARRVWPVAVALGVLVLSSGHRMLAAADAQMSADRPTPADVDAEVSGEVADEFGGAPDAIDEELRSRHGRPPSSTRA